MRRYYNVEPKLARVIEPGDQYPVEKVVESVVKSSADVLLTFDDGSMMRLNYDDSLLMTAPLADSPAAASAEAAAAASTVLAEQAGGNPPGDEAEA